MKKQLIDKLSKLFVDGSDRYVIHKEAASMLEKVALSKDFLYEIIRENLSNPDFISKKRHYSTLSMPIHESADFSLVVNIFPPLPNRDINISFQSIHHHGSLLLTTVGLFGPGYDSILYKKGFKINTDNNVVELVIEKEYHNVYGKADFIDSYQPHVVFYPTDFSATLAFWCNEKKTAKDSMKKVGLLKKVRKPVLKAIEIFGLSKLLGINKVEYFDFYVESGKVIALKERLTYNLVGSNENFLQNIFCFVQKVGFKDIDFLTTLTGSDNPSIAKFSKMILENVTISDSFFEGHLNIDRVNLFKRDIVGASC